MTRRRRQRAGMAPASTLLVLAEPASGDLGVRRARRLARTRARRAAAGRRAAVLVPTVVALSTAGWALAAEQAPTRRPLEAAAADPVATTEPPAGRTPGAGATDEPDGAGAAVTGAGAAPSRGRLVIHGVGDVNLDPRAVPGLAQRGYDFPWSGVGDLFLGDGLTVANLECAASPLGAPVAKAFTFRCDPGALDEMRAGGVDVANLANNHSRDFGPDALLDSRARLAAAGVHPVGVGADDLEATRPALVEVDGWRVAVLGFGGVVPARDWLAGPGHPGMASGDDTEAMVAAVAAVEQIADVVVVTIHWGVELDERPRPDDVARAHALVGAGADVIFGHHSHRLNPLDWHADRPIAWSLGNFVWPTVSAAGARTAVARVEVEPDGSIRACLLPAVIDAPGHPVLTAPAADCPPV